MGTIANNISYHQWKQREAAAQCNAEAAEQEWMIAATRASLSAEELADELIRQLEMGVGLDMPTRQRLIALAMNANH